MVKPRPVKLPQTASPEERRKREADRKIEQAIEDARNDAYRAKLNRLNGIGVKKT